MYSAYTHIRKQGTKEYKEMETLSILAGSSLPSPEMSIFLLSIKYKYVHIIKMSGSFLHFKERINSK